MAETVSPNHVLAALNEVTDDWVEASEVACYVEALFGSQETPMDGRSVARVLMRLATEGAVECRERSSYGPPPALWRLTEKGHAELAQWFEIVT